MSVTSKEQEKPVNSILERHVQTILVSLILASILWVGNTLNDTSRSLEQVRGQIAVIDTSLQFMKTNLTDMKNNNYTQPDAQRDLRNIDFRLESLESRLSTMETIVRERDRP